MSRVDGISSRLSRITRENIQEHPLLVVIALVLALVAIVFLIWLTLSTAQPVASAAATAIPLPVRPAVVSSPPELPLPTEPAHLTIPAIGLSASVESVGLTKTGAMAVPSNTNNVGWFSLGYRPGEVGNAVLTGH